ncbi:MAG TPA: glutamate 5-kinase [Terriglobales bacterium]|nr:glutamate 5-kinase [Terriglobales bacterium]
MRVRTQLEDAQTIVVKVGTKVLLRTDGTIAEDAFRQIARSMARLQRNGRRVLLVSSGAVGLGARSLGVSPSLVSVCAAAGQSVLTSLYYRAFGQLGISIAQLLVTDDDFRAAERRQKLLQTLDHLSELGVVPILNENDAVTHSPDTTPRIISDNDMLASLVAKAVNADLLVILTDVDGIYDTHPDEAEASLIPEITGAHVLEHDFPVSEFGRGGVQAKLKAALHVAQMHQVVAVIANGRTPDVLDKIIGGHEIGTLIAPVEAK